MKPCCNPIQNVDFKLKLQQKMDEIKSNIDNFWKDGPKKEDILKQNNSKVKPGISTYSQKKKMLEEKYMDKKSTYHQSNITSGKTERLGGKTDRQLVKK